MRYMGGLKSPELVSSLGVRVFSGGHTKLLRARWEHGILRRGQCFAMTKDGLCPSGTGRDRRASNRGAIPFAKGVARGSGVTPTNKRMGVERRRHLRHPAQPELGRKSIVLSAFCRRSREYLGAHLQNISGGGVCLLSDYTFEPSEVFRCEIPLPELAVRVPTLLLVRWINRPRGTHTYRVGLQFVF